MARDPEMHFVGPSTARTLSRWAGRVARGTGSVNLQSRVMLHFVATPSVREPASRHR